MASKKVTFGINNASSPAPVIWKRISDSIKYFLVGYMGLIPSAGVYTPDKIAHILFWCGIVIFALKAVDMGLGVKVEDESK